LRRTSRRRTKVKVSASSFIIALILLLTGVPAAGQAQEKGPFVLGPGDVLEISVWRDEALTREVTIRPDGRISFPLIGDVTASGRSVDELRSIIQDKLKVYVPDAPVSVLPIQINSTKVYVVGKVNQPGVYLMSEPLNVMQLLAMAGGLNAFANEGRIMVLRQEGEEHVAINFDYKRISSGRDLTQNFLLRPNDTIIVP
jgi:polysaccharide biosynthesis/export protein